MSETRPRPSQPADYLSRKEALEILRIKPQTLYCYVSRGYIRSLPQPDGRSSYYLREDVEKAKAKSVARSGHGPAAASAMRWGEPVIDTGITEITPRGPRYRSRLALELAATDCAFEAVAEYLWTGIWMEQPAGWRLREERTLAPLLAAHWAAGPDAHLLQLLGLAAASLGLAHGEEPVAETGFIAIRAARQMIRGMTGTFGFLSGGKYVPLEEGESIARGLARALGVALQPGHVQALNAALVLIADHELNPATFAARIAASGGAALHACVGAALSVHSGTLIGRGCDAVERLFETGTDARAMLAAASTMRDDAQKLPGFNHPLYAQGDPRTRMLIELARGIGGDRPVVRNMLEALSRMEGELGMKPSIETGLVLLARAVGAPERSASGIFALGRAAGWVAHILEQREQAFLIRPRAKFGPGEAVRAEPEAKWT
jgi:citrate synthase